MRGTGSLAVTCGTSSFQKSLHPDASKGTVGSQIPCSGPMKPSLQLPSDVYHLFLHRQSVTSTYGGLPRARDSLSITEKSSPVRLPFTHFCFQHRGSTVVLKCNQQGFDGSHLLNSFSLVSQRRHCGSVIAQVFRPSWLSCVRTLGTEGL